MIRFGPDGKLYVIMGDNGRRGRMQNLPCGPTPICEGPFRQSARCSRTTSSAARSRTTRTSRVSCCGSTTTAARRRTTPSGASDSRWAARPGENFKKVFAIGFRNSFGMAFDPVSGDLWEQENGDDTFDEINRVERGMNGGWVQLAGPIERVAQFRELESTFGGRSLQQLRWPPANIAETPERGQAAAAVHTAGAHYSDPEFSWKWAVPPGGIGFVDGDGLGEDFAGDLFVGGATQGTMGGHLFRFRLDKHRRDFALDDPGSPTAWPTTTPRPTSPRARACSRAAASGSLTDIQTGPDGHLYAVSTNRGTIYEIFPR